MMEQLLFHTFDVIDINPIIPEATTTTNIVEITDEEANEINNKYAVIPTTKLTEFLRDKTNKYDAIYNNIAGIVYGCAIGDCMGQQCRGKTYDIIKLQNPNGISTYSSQGISGRNPYEWSYITDQLIVFIKTALSSDDMVRSFEVNLYAKQLKDWYLKGFSTLDNKKPNCSYMLANVFNSPEYLDNPIKAAKDFYKSTGNTISFNCVLPRSAMFALFPNWQSLVIRQCMLTHVDPRCVYAAFIIAKITRRILKGEPTLDIDELFIDFKDFLPFAQRGEMLKYVAKYKSCIASNDLTNLNLDNGTMSEQQYVLKSLGCAIYAYYNTDKGIKILYDVLYAGGDTPINCALVGIILGAKHGYTGFESNLITGLVNYKWLELRLLDLLKQV